MTYFPIAIITDRVTGQVARHDIGHPWEDIDGYMWSDGNYGCDCNRSLFFARARGEDDAEHEECGETRFHVEIVGPDGARLYIDKGI